MIARDPRGLTFESLRTVAPSFDIVAKGSWYMEGGAPRTRVEGTFASSNFREAARSLGYRDVVDAERARLTASLWWPGGPSGDAIKSMSGTLRLALEDGRLRDVEPGAGRMLGLLSVAQLPRRLSLDFRDVTDAGLAFDSVEGDFELRAGNAFTQNLLLKGPAVDIGIVGRTGLAAEDYDQTVIVSGNTSGPLAVAGALAAGPVVGAGVLVLSQLFKDQLQGLARVYYHVSGPWSAPVVERISAPAARRPRARRPMRDPLGVNREQGGGNPDDLRRGRRAQPRERLCAAARRAPAGRRRWSSCPRTSRSWDAARRPSSTSPRRSAPGRSRISWPRLPASTGSGWSRGTVPIRVPGETRVAAACLVFDGAGRQVARYDKIHLFDVDVPGKLESHRESKAVRPGSQPVVVDTPAGRLGLAVCYDVRFPELFRQLLAEGAEWFSLPSAFTVPTGRAHWELLLRTRAVENLCYLVAAAQSGFHENGRETHGDSMIVEPWGRVVARLPRGTGVITAELDLARQRRLRQDFPAVDHRRLGPVAAPVKET